MSASSVAELHGMEQLCSVSAMAVCRNGFCNGLVRGYLYAVQEPLTSKVESLIWCRIIEYWCGFQEDTMATTAEDWAACLCDPKTQRLLTILYHY